jgi:hypothetical protein
MDGSVPSNPHLKWHICNSLANLFSSCVVTRKSDWRWDIGGKQANQQPCLLIDPANNLMINYFAFIQLHFQCLKLAGHNSTFSVAVVKVLLCSSTQFYSLLEEKTLLRVQSGSSMCFWLSVTPTIILVMPCLGLLKSCKRCTVYFWSCHMQLLRLQFCSVMFWI